MEMYFCNSCAMPLEKVNSSHCCAYCSDEQGNLKPREEVKRGVAQWLESWAPEKTGVDFLARAEAYLHAMPAWNK